MKYMTTGVCAYEIDFDVEDNRVHNVKFYGGCPGNHLGLAALVEGMDIDEVITRLSGISCGMRLSSCPDQLAEGLKKYKEAHK